MTMLDADRLAKEFLPGSTGWTAADLDDPEVERKWMAGRYEIIEGVLSMMAAAHISGGESLVNLLYVLQNHVRMSGGHGGFADEVDVVIDEQRVVRADAVYMDPEAKRRQHAAAIAEGRRDLRRTRILVPPTLVIESVSPGHEAHDRVTKRRWYAEFGVPNYWLLDVFGRSLECLVLDGGQYRVDAAGRESDAVTVAAFPGLVLPLGEVWSE